MLIANSANKCSNGMGGGARAAGLLNNYRSTINTVAVRSETTLNRISSLSVLSVIKISI